MAVLLQWHKCRVSHNKLLINRENTTSTYDSKCSEILTICCEKDELVIKIYFRQSKFQDFLWTDYNRNLLTLKELVDLKSGGLRDLGYATRRRGQYIGNTVFLPLKYENIFGYFGLFVFKYKVYNIYHVFLNFSGYLDENVSKLGNFYKLNKKCAIYLSKWLSRIRTFNITVTIIIPFS